MNQKNFTTKDLNRSPFSGNEHNSNSLAEVPYFERQQSDDFVALQEARQIIDVLHHRVRSLENINIDLEYRLEQQAKQTMQAEHEYTEIDRSWRAKFVELQKESNDWEKKHEVQVMKTERLHEQLYRTERELYGILQRKHQLMRGGVPHGALGEVHGGTSSSQLQGLLDAAAGGGAGASSRPAPTLPTPLSPRGGSRGAGGGNSSTPLSSATGPVEDLCDVYKKLTPELRERRFIMDMGDFFGVYT